MIIQISYQGTMVQECSLHDVLPVIKVATGLDETMIVAILNSAGQGYLSYLSYLSLPDGSEIRKKAEG